MEKNQILSLFQTIQQQAATLGLSESEEAYCQDMQAVYDAAIAFYMGLMAHIDANQPKDNPFCKDRIDVETSIITAQKAFIANIYEFFRSEYSVELSPDNTLKRYNFHDGDAYTRRHYDEVSATPIHYRDIVQDILAQTGNLPFDALAVHQMKAEFAPKVTWRSKDERVKQTGATLNFESYASIETRWDGGMRIRYSGEQTIRLLYRVLSHFERGEIVKRDEIFQALPCATNDYDLDLTPYLVGGAKVYAVRFFKNGKVAVKFASAALAAEFQRAYCHEVVA